MKRIDQVFTVHRAKSGLFSDYEPGTVPYVGNGFGDNAVVGFVTPLPKDRVFKFLGITISAFCEATVQAPPFVACGRAGNGLVVLEPKEPMTPGQLSYVAVYINRALRWRFSWYWQTTADRIKRLRIPNTAPDAKFDVSGALPEAVEIPRPKVRVKLRPVSLGSIYDLVRGAYHNASDLEPGEVPLVSCGEIDNGIIGYYSVPKIHEHKLTIALNGRPLTARYHPYTFAAKDDVAVCIPRAPLELTTEMFIQAMLNQERWRFSYYRKCYIEKLNLVKLPLPVKNGGIDEDAIRGMIQATPYWNFIESHIPTVEVAP